ncbi:MAG: MBL fold metallo-hydrolase [Chloroflexi bacterium]|nr:MBL fold metallo-hydrolase [Chloroflexota bacterium]
MPEIETKEIAKDVFQIDTLLLGIPHFCAVYLIKGEKLALMDAGDHTTADNVLAGLKKVGVAPQDISYIFCSHIHLDHSGAAGQLVERMPKAQVVVHERGARHLIDPSKLIESYGNLGGDPTLRKLLRPAPASQVVTVKGGETFSLGRDKTVQVIATPGHAPHCASYFYSQHRGLFCGDSVGIYLAEEKVLMPVAAPGYDHDLALSSLKAMASLPVESVFFPHWSMHKNVKDIFAFAQKQWSEWGALAEGLFKAGKADQIEEKLRERARKDIRAVEGRKSLYDYMIGDLISLSAQGYKLCFERKAARG